ncbi:MAG: hypothetical protein ACOYMM_06950 [Phycisphaerales bacterium]|jgi:hypothetical protein
MRPLHACIDVLVVGCGALALVTALSLYESHLDEKSVVDSTRAALSTIRAEVGIHSAIGDVELNEFGHPHQIDPSWFSDAPAKNMLATQSAPWVELALPGELDKNHPKDPTFRGGRGAMFWYNPVRGIVRARVPDQTTDESTLALYEQINGESWEN